MYQVAYYKGPEQYHASYGIRVKQSDLKYLTMNEENQEDFTNLSALIRINETVSKVF